MMEQVDGLFDEQQPFLCPDAVIENFLGKLLAIRYTSGVIQIESNDFGRCQHRRLLACNNDKTELEAALRTRLWMMNDELMMR